MWQLALSADYERRHKRYVKKRPRELKAALDNLDTFFKALQRGAKPQQIKTGFIHPEPQGVLAIDQKGGGPGLQQTRLYVYPHEETETLHIVILGDKGSQSEDIEFCREFVTDLLKRSDRP